MTEEHTPTKPDSLASVLVKNSTIALLIQTAGVGGGYIVQVFLARWTGAEAYGVFAYFLAWAQTLSMLCLFGLDAIVLRFIPEYRVNERPDLLRGLLRWGRLMVMGISIILSGGIFVLAITAGWISSNQAAFAIAIALVPLLAQMEIHTQLLRSARRIVAAYLPPQVIQPVFILIGTFTLMTYTSIRGGGLDMLAAVWIALLLVVLGQRWMVQREYLSGSGKPVATAYDIRRWMTAALPMYAITVFSSLLLRVDTIIVGWYLDSQYVALYSVAVKTATFVSFPLVAANAILAPLVAAQYANRDVRGMQGLIRLAAIGTFTGAGCAAIALIFSAEPLLALFGEGFSGAREILVVLIAGQLINVGAGPVGLLLMMTGHERYCLPAFFAASAIQIALCLWWTPWLGVKGAALSSLIGMAVWNIWLNTAVRKLLKLQPDIVSALISSLKKHSSIRAG